MAAVIWSLGPVATYVAGVVLVNFAKPFKLINWPLESRSIWMLALTGVPLELWTVTVEKGATEVLSFRSAGQFRKTVQVDQLALGVQINLDAGADRRAIGALDGDR